METALFAKGIARLEFNRSRKRVLAGAAALLAGAFVYAFSKDENVSMVVGMILLQPAGTILLFDVKVVEGIVKYCFSSAYASFFHLPIHLGFTILDEVATLHLSDNWRQIILTVITLFVIYVVSRIIEKHKNIASWIKEIPTVYFLLAYFCGASTNGISACIRYVAPEVSRPVRVILSVLNFVVSMFLYTVGIGFAVANMWRKQYKEESRLKDKYIKKIKEYYQSLEEHIKGIQRIRHDMNSHFNILDKYAESGDSDMLKSYLSEIKEQSHCENLSIVNVGNSIVSAVLTEAMRTVDSKERISLVCDGALPEKLLISDYDLCTIFSNLMSNSIEACRRLTESERRIYIEFSINGNSLCITFRNPIEWEVDEEHFNGGYTSKSDKLRHGYGVENIKKAVGCYDSDIKIYVKDGMFVTKIAFYRAVG